MDAIGGFDERFYPGYYVDVNLSMALRQLGFIVLYQPKSRIRHHLSSSTTPRFRNFISRRNRLLFLEKWSTALEAHEPPGRDDPAAVHRALARAEAFAQAVRLRGAPALDQFAKPNSYDPVLQERQHREKSRMLQKAYVVHLTERIDAAEFKLAELGRELAELGRELAQHRARSRTFASLERGWRWTYRQFQRLKRPSS